MEINEKILKTSEEVKLSGRNMKMDEVKIFSGVMSKMSNKPDLFHEALEAARTHNEDAFKKALTKASIPPREAAVTWMMMDDIIEVILRNW